MAQRVWKGLLAGALLAAAFGCAQNPVSSPVQAAPDTAAPPQALVSASATPGVTSEEIQSVNEKRLFFLYRFLLQVDRKPGLSLRKSQAEAMLPIVRGGSRTGSIDETEGRKLVALLSAGQKTDFERLVERYKSKAGLTEEEESLLLTDRNVEQQLLDLLETKLK